MRTNKWKICEKCVDNEHCEATPFGNKIVRKIIRENKNGSWFNPLSFQYFPDLKPCKTDKRLCDKCKYRFEHLVMKDE